MPLHDAVGINCKKGANAENQRLGLKYIGCDYLMIVCELSDSTWLPILGGGRKLWYIIIIIIIKLPLFINGHFHSSKQNTMYTTQSDLNYNITLVLNKTKPFFLLVIEIFWKQF